MPPGRVVNFTDSQLQDCYERNFAAVTDFPPDLRRARPWMGAHVLFQMLEGPPSTRVHETMEHPLVPGLRRGPRRWYQRSGAETNPAAVALRDHLSQLAGERSRCL